MGAPLPVPIYARRRPEESTLYKMVQDNLATLYGAVDDGALPIRLPGFVRKELVVDSSTRSKLTNSQHESPLRVRTVREGRAMTKSFDVGELERFVKDSQQVAALDRRIADGRPITFTRSYGYFEHLASMLVQTGLVSLGAIEAKLDERGDDVVRLAKEWLSREPGSPTLPSGICLRYLALLEVATARTPVEQKLLLIDLGLRKDVDAFLIALGTPPPEAPPAKDLARRLGDLAPAYERFLIDSRQSRVEVTSLRDGFEIHEARARFRSMAIEIDPSGYVPLARCQVDGVGLFLMAVEGPDRGKVFFWWDEEAALLTEVAPTLEAFSVDLFERPPTDEWPWELLVSEE